MKDTFYHESFVKSIACNETKVLQIKRLEESTKAPEVPRSNTRACSRVFSLAFHVDKLVVLFSYLFVEQRNIRYSDGSAYADTGNGKCQETCVTGTVP